MNRNNERVFDDHGHRSEVSFPGGPAVHCPVRGVAPPHALDEPGRGGDLAVEVLLPLLLLHLQSESGAQNALADCVNLCQVIKIDSYCW